MVKILINGVAWGGFMGLYETWEEWQIAANGEDPDQTAPIGAVGSGSALLAQGLVSKYFRSLWSVAH